VGPPGPPPGPQPPSFAVSPHEREESLKKAVEILERLVADHPAAPDYRHLLARSYREVSAQRFGGGPAWAPDAAARAAVILETLVKEHPDVPDYRFDLSETYAWPDFRWPFAPEEADQAGRQRSQQRLEKALAISTELVAEHPNIPDYAVSQVSLRLRLADMLWRTDPAAAEAHLRKALEVQLTLAKRFPKNSFYPLGTAIIHESLAGLLQDLHDVKRLPEARSALQNSIASFREVLQKDPKSGFVRGVLAQNYATLAEVLRKLGDGKAAVEADRQAQALRPGR
jgi:tetratricopeptide (TPR) repeat protein